MKRSSTAAEKRHLFRIASMGCIVCRECLGYHDTPAVVHHVHVNFGWGRTSHFDTIPLCSIHHVAPNQSVHGMGREEFTETFGMSEIQLLDIVQKELGVK